MKSLLSYLILFIIIVQPLSLKATKLNDWLQTHKIKLASAKLPSVQILIGDEKKVLESFSEKESNTSKLEINKESLFDLASMSKVFTALGLQIALHHSKYNLDSKVGDILSSDSILIDKKNALNALKGHSLRELLLHQSTLPEIYQHNIISRGHDLIWGDIYGHLNKFPKSKVCKTKTRKGEKPYCYKDIHYLLIGRVIETLSSMSLVDFYNDYIFCPLGLDSFLSDDPAPRQIFALSEKHQQFETHSDSLRFFNKMVPSYPKAMYRSPNNLLIPFGEVYKNIFHDPKVKKMGGVAGHAGVISSASAFQKIIETFLDSRIVEDGIIKAREGQHPQLDIPYKSIYQIFSRKFMSRHGRGLGVDIESQYSRAPSGQGSFGKTSFGHTGYTGTSFWVDACTGLYYIFLGNRTHVDTDIKSVHYERKLVAQKTIELYSTKETCRYE